MLCEKINPNIKYYQIQNKSQFQNPKTLRFGLGILDLFGNIGIILILDFSSWKELILFYVKHLNISINNACGRDDH